MCKNQLTDDANERLLPQQASGSRNAQRQLRCLGRAHACAILSIRRHEEDRSLIHDPWKFAGLARLAKAKLHPSELLN